MRSADSAAGEVRAAGRQREKERERDRETARLTLAGV